ncbi:MULTISPECIES: lysylphosphatidylglycerol synthase domain-containing protein [Pacificibacter]|uniref:lysylphosphatidylglycerol synthase domain-containing protein n=1 Tax=Pacificibacter TaxID=1042323 RepID=UPI001C08FAA2|nr:MULTISPECIES: lysylphosphatidylglycerol synthase domain-containing protein [Pacificibacter]MBU2936756.1 flippase-like domain-containing protein [Pacificibacter marinus]MDO6614749.1 lysylphosphatidylglycerol synthase domain-containing protein [Pacificibacter sp. 1_MG-2023]
MIRLLTATGVLVSLLAIGCVGYAIHSNWATIAAFDYAQMDFKMAGASVLLYVLCIVVAGLNWTQILRNMDKSLRIRPVFSVFIVAQLGRYLPGNIGHFVGRAVLGRALGIPLTLMAVTSVIEVLAALAAGAVIFIVVYVFVPDIFAQALAFLPPQATPMRVILLLLAIMLAAAFVTRKFKSREAMPRIGAGLWTAATGLAGLSLVLTGLSFGVFMHSIAALTSEQFVLTLVVFAMAWLAGYVTPGAPAGLGVREVVILAFLTPVFGATSALTVSVLHRVMCTIIDLVTSAMGVGLYIWVKRDNEKLRK